MTAPWWAAFGPAEASIGCGAEQHRVGWADGALLALDHADAEGESVLAALGAAATPCVDLLRGWATHGDDLRVLAIAPRSAGDALTITTRVLDEVSTPAGWIGAPFRHPAHVALLRHQIARTIASGGGTFAHTGWSGLAPSRMATWRASAGRPGRQREEPTTVGLLRLLALGPAFQLRLSGAVAHAWSADGQHAADRARVRPAMTAALAGRLVPAVAQWLGIDADQVQVALHDGDGWGEIEAAAFASARRVRARLAADWLARVWAPGLAVVGGHLVVSVQHAQWPTAQVLGVPALDRPAVELNVRHGGRGWTITP